MRLYKFEARRKPGSWTSDKAPGYIFSTTQYWPNEFCEKFLHLKPRPTIVELMKALYPLGWDLRKWKNVVRDPETKQLKYDPERYKELLEKETLKRREYMQQVIESRQGTKTETIPAEAAP